MNADTKPHEIIEIWINHAVKIKAGPYIKQFRIARDILEGRIKVPDKMAKECIAWIRKNTKHSADKAVLLSALDEKILLDNRV